MKSDVCTQYNSDKDPGCDLHWLNKVTRRTSEISSSPILHWTIRTDTLKS